MASTRIGSVCDVSSSDSSDEDENRRFVEAAVLDCHHSTSMSGNSDTKSSSKYVGLPRPRQDEGRCERPSLRTSKQDSHEAENELNTTPEFRAFIGKKLSAIIDSMIEISVEERNPGHVEEADSTPKDSGVRLFSSSSHPLCLSESAPEKRSAKKRPVESSSSDSSEDEKLASAAVSHDFIFEDYKPTEKLISETKILTGTDDAQESVKKKKKKKKRHKVKISDVDKAETDTHFSVDAEANGTGCQKKKRKKDKNLDVG